jgi:hypothetical protein
MSVSVIERVPNPARRKWWISIGCLVLAGAFAYLWVLPLLRPRGDFLWGFYRLKDIFVGIPVALMTLCVLAVLLSPSKYRRLMALRFASLGISIVLMLFLCDAVYSMILMGAWRSNFWLDAAHITRKYSIPDHELGFVRKPEVSWKGYLPDLNRIIDYRTDENGFRNLTGIRQADIVFIGDSYTEAAQVTEEETFASLVAKLSGLKVVNLGRGAYGPQQELIVLQRYGLAYRPQVVIWQLFEGNDIGDAREFAEWKKNPEQSRVPLKERYFSNSFLTDLLNRTRLPESKKTMVTVRYQNGNAFRITPRYSYEPGEPDSFPEGFSETKRSIEAGYRLCQANGVRLLLVNVPTMVRVMEPYLTFDRMEDRARFFPEGNGKDLKDFSRRTQEFCMQLGVPFMDSFDALRQAAALGTTRLYVPNDEHLDVGGHQVIAQAVLKWLSSQSVVDQRQTPITQ